MIANHTNTTYKLLYELQILRQAIHDEIIKCLETGKLLHELVTERERLQKVEEQLAFYKVLVDHPTL